MIIERLIESAMVTRVSARAYVVANSVPVRRYDDRVTKDQNIIAVVACSPVAKIAPNADYYTTTIALSAQNHSEHDIEGISEAGLYADLLDEIMIDLTASSLTASIADASVVIDGVVPEEGSYDGSDSYKMHTAQAKLFLSYESPPVNSVLPVISGTTEVGETLSVSDGTWTHASSYAYQWRQDEVELVGETESSYELVIGDLGTDIDCVVTATNVTTTTDATAVEVGPITSP